MDAYVTVDEVRRTLGVTDSDIIPDDVITQAIEFAEDEIDRITFTTYYPVLETGRVTSATDTTLVETNKEWNTDDLTGYAVYIYAGTGIGQIREITDNDETSVTVATWTTNPDSTSRYIITYLNKETVNIDGTGGSTILLKDYPIVQIDSLKIEDTEIDSDDYIFYKDTGRIVLLNTAAKTSFTKPIGNIYNQAVEITYHWGVLPEVKRGRIETNRIIKRATCLVASLQALAYQIGGTYDDASTWNLPEMGVSRGQAYINIKGVVDVLVKELEDFKNNYLGKYIYMA